MVDPGFADLVAAVAEGMGQRPDSVRSTPDGLFLHTTDGFLFVFIEDPGVVSLTTIERLLDEPAGRAGKLALLTPGRLPLALADAARAGRASVVDHERFRELLRGLDLAEWIGEEPRAPHDVPGPRLLPSARHLDAVVARARTWLDWGVPALALRFYRQALATKPDFGPARVGIGRSLVGLGLLEDARAEFDAVLRDHPGDLEARIGLAQLDAAAGNPSGEMARFREILEERPDRDDVRAQLIAAEVDAGSWSSARGDLELLLLRTPEDPRLRFLLSAVLGHLGETNSADRERDRARGLGLSEAEENALCAHLGLPPPAPDVARRAPPVPALRPEAAGAPPDRPPAKPRRSRKPVAREKPSSSRRRGGKGK